MEICVQERRRAVYSLFGVLMATDLCGDFSTAILAFNISSFACIPARRGFVATQFRTCPDHFSKRIRLIMLKFVL